MRERAAKLVGAMAVLGSLSLWGCDRAAPPNGPPPSTQPTVDAAPALAKLADGWNTWSVELALLNLAYDELALSAAVRLVRLADVTPAMVPDPLPASLAEALSVVPLGEDGWAVGVVERDAPRRMWGPVLIDTEGAVHLVAEGSAEPVVLHIAEQPEVFPHVALCRDEVVLPRRPDVTAIWLLAPDSVGFTLSEQGGFPYVGLVMWPDRDVEVARYLWDPYELVFTGPASNHLPDPPGGAFEIDIESSKLLEPQGGLIDAPEELPSTPDVVPPDEVEPV